LYFSRAISRWESRRQSHAFHHRNEKNCDTRCWPPPLYHPSSKDIFISPFSPFYFKIPKCLAIWKLIQSHFLLMLLFLLLFFAIVSQNVDEQNSGLQFATSQSITTHTLCLSMDLWCFCSCVKRPNSPRPFSCITRTDGTLTRTGSTFTSFRLVPLQCPAGRAQKQTERQRDTYT
jgi:hypothetical protein